MAKKQIGAAIIGTAIGAVAVAFSDKKNRKKIKKSIDEVKKWGDNAVSELKEKADTFKEKISTIEEDEKVEVKKNIENGKSVNYSFKKKAGNKQQIL